MSLPHITLLYSLSGLGVGFLVGLTGVGGGSLMTPILVLLFGVHPATAVGTDLLYAAATKATGTLAGVTNSSAAPFPHGLDIVPLGSRSCRPMTTHACASPVPAAQVLPPSAVEKNAGAQLASAPTNQPAAGPVRLIRNTCGTGALSGSQLRPPSVVAARCGETLHPGWARQPSLAPLKLRRRDFER